MGAVCGVVLLMLLFCFCFDQSWIGCEVKAKQDRTYTLEHVLCPCAKHSVVFRQAVLCITQGQTTPGQREALGPNCSSQE